MVFASPSRRFKTLRRKRDPMPPPATTAANGAAAHQPVSPAAAYPPEPSAAYPPASSGGPMSPGADSAYAPRGSGDQGAAAAAPGLSPDESARAQMAGTGSPDDIVVYRLSSWRILIKEYIDYFTAFAAAQKTARKALEKATAEFSVPLGGDHCFAGPEHGGVQSIAAHLRDTHAMYAAQYSRLIHNIEADTLPRLETLRSEVKDNVKAYVKQLSPAYRRLRKQAKEVEACKARLARTVEAYERKGRGPDAWLVRQQVRRELARQAELENALHRAMQAEHARLLDWEANMTARLRDVVGSAVACERAGLHASTAAADGFAVFLDRLDPSAEPRAFDRHFGPALRSPMGLTGWSTLEDYDYMYRDCRLTSVVLEGPLQRERGVIKRFQQSYVVLTAQGYLHCYSDHAQLLQKAPDLSLSLANCALVSLDDPCMFVVVSADRKLGRSRHAFRTPGADATEHWVNAIDSAIPRDPEPTTPQPQPSALPSRGPQSPADSHRDAPSPLPPAADGDNDNDGEPGAEPATREAQLDDGPSPDEESSPDEGLSPDEEPIPRSAPAGRSSPGHASSGRASAKRAPAEQALAERSSPGHASSGRASAKRTPVESTAAKGIMIGDILAQGRGADPEPSPIGEESPPGPGTPLGPGAPLTPADLALGPPRDAGATQPRPAGRPKTQQMPMPMPYVPHRELFSDGDDQD